MAGDSCVVVESEARAGKLRNIVRASTVIVATRGARGSVEQMLSAIAAGEAAELPVVIKPMCMGRLKQSGLPLKN